MPQEKNKRISQEFLDYLKNPVQQGEWTLSYGQYKVQQTVTSPGRYLAHFPPRYGKTSTAYNCYARLRNIGLVDRMLIIVSQTTLIDQMEKKMRQDFKSLGYEFKGVTKCDEEHAVLSSQKARYDVYVTTIQTFINKERILFFGDGIKKGVLQYGKWMVVVDECHNFSIQNVWGKALSKIPYEVMLGLSASPNNQSGDSYFLQDDVKEVFVSYAEGKKEGRLRNIITQTGSYEVDLLDDENNIVTINTDSIHQTLKEENVSNWSEYEVKKELRYSDKYFSPMILKAISEMEEKENKDQEFIINNGGIRKPLYNQMLIFAWSVNHAKHLEKVINTRLTMEPNYARYIGTGLDGLSVTQNREIKKSFDNGEIKCLIQVQYCAQGYDNKRCSFLLYLGMVGESNLLYQMITRVVTINPDLHVNGNRERDYGTFYTSSDNYDAINIAKDLEEGNNFISPSGEYKKPEPNDDPWDWYFPSLEIVKELIRVELKTWYEGLIHKDKEKQILERIKKLGAKNLEVVGVFTEEEVKAYAKQIAIEVLEEQEKKEFEERTRDDLRKLIAVRVKKMAYSIAKSSSGNNINSQSIADATIRINSFLARKFGKTKSLDRDALEEKYKYLKEIKERLQSGEIIMGISL